MLNPIFLLTVSIAAALAYEQVVVVKGIVNCRGQRQAGTFVQLYEEDTLPFFDDDDLMGAEVADNRGVFCIKGHADEITLIEPYIYIEHNCGYEGLHKKVFYKHVVPVTFVTSGSKGKKIYHMGDIELLDKDAPIQKFTKRPYSVKSSEDMMRQCIPLYAQYKLYYEKQIFDSDRTASVILPSQVNEAERVELNVRDNVMERTSHQSEYSLNTTDSRTHLTIVHDNVSRKTEEEVNQRHSVVESEQQNLERSNVQQTRISTEVIDEERQKEEKRRQEVIQKMMEQRRIQEEEHRRRLEEYYEQEKKRQELIAKRKEAELSVEESKKNEEIEVQKKNPCRQYPVFKKSNTNAENGALVYIDDPCYR